MKRRFNSNTLILSILLGIIALVSIDVGRRMLAGPVPEPATPTVEQRVKPDFAVGDLAPDFELPDEKKKPTKMSTLVKGDTILAFSCGCNQCRDYQTFLGKLTKVMGDKAPHVISVNSTDPSAAEAWIRDTKLPQSMLYGRHTDPPVKPYHGTPCPRAFRLDKDRKVRWIGGSMAEQKTSMQLGIELAQQLNFQPSGGKDPKKYQMPNMEWVSSSGAADLPPGIVTPPAPPKTGAADDHAGHNHPPGAH